MYIMLEDHEVKKYSVNNTANGTKKCTSGKIECDSLTTLIGKEVYVELKDGLEELQFVTRVKAIKVRKYLRPYVSCVGLKYFIGKKLDINIIEVEQDKK